MITFDFSCKREHFVVVVINTLNKIQIGFKLVIL